MTPHLTLTPGLKRTAVLVVVALVLLMVVVPALFYVVDERELAVVLQFGDPVAERMSPGLGVKIPWVQQVRKLPKTRQFWGGGPEHVQPDLPTSDGKKVDVTPWAVWRIKQPKIFVQRFPKVQEAEQRVSQIVRGAVRNVITAYELTELVRSTERELTYSFTPERMLTKVSADQVQERPRQAKAKIEHGREKIVQEIKKKAMSDLVSEGAGGGRGIELIDVGIAQIDFVPQVREAAFDRLIAFMESIAALYENEGELEKQEILNQTQADVQEIEGKGKKQANETRGKVDAEIITQYAKAIEQAGEFYTFVRTLEAYKEALSSDTRLILTTDSDFLGLIKELGKAPPPVASRPTSRAAKR